MKKRVLNKPWANSPWFTMEKTLQNNREKKTLNSLMFTIFLGLTKWNCILCFYRAFCCIISNVMMTWHDCISCINFPSPPEDGEYIVDCCLEVLHFAWKIRNVGFLRYWSNFLSKVTCVAYIFLGQSSTLHSWEWILG